MMLWLTSFINPLLQGHSGVLKEQHAFMLTVDVLVVCIFDEKHLAAVEVLFLLWLNVLESGLFLLGKLFMISLPLVVVFLPGLLEMVLGSTR